METTYGVHWSTNTKGHPYEDRYVLALGDFPARLDRATTRPRKRSGSDASPSARRAACSSR